MKHAISIGPPWWQIGEIIWDDVASTVTGTISDLATFSDQSILPRLSAKISNGPLTVGCPWGSVELRDPAHDPADFLRALLSVTMSFRNFSLPDSLSRVSPIPFPPLPQSLPNVDY